MSAFLESPLFFILLMIITSVVAVVGGGHLTLWLLKRKQGYPGETQIEKALKQYAHSAIMYAYKVSEAQADELGTRLHGVDKKLIATAFYGLLPSEIVVPLPGGGVFILPIDWVKKLFSEEDFANIIEGVFGELEDFLESTQGKFGKEVEDLLKEITGDWS